MDDVEVFEFLSAFFACVLLGYRSQLETRLPVIALLLACCAACGFLKGVWPLGFLLVVIAVIEARQWWTAGLEVTAPSEPVPLNRSHRTAASPSRLSRMFGSI